MNNFHIFLLFILFTSSLTLTDEPIKKSTYCLSTSSEECVNFLLEISKYFLFFAAKGYCDPNEQVFTDTCCQNAFTSLEEAHYEFLGWNLSLINDWELIDSGYSEASYEERGNIFTNEKNYYIIYKNDILKKVVISFPGTKNSFVQLAGEIVNSRQEGIENSDDEVKSSIYFQRKSKYLLSIVFSEENISKMKLNENYQIIFTGHSLGAAIGANMIIMASMKNYINKEKNFPILVSYGQPRTGNKYFNEKLNNYTEMIIRNVNDDDLVTQIPLYNDDKESSYVHPGGELYISGSGMDISSDNTVYIDEEFVDVQKMSYLELLKNAINNRSKHIYYYGVHVGQFCN